MARRRSKRKKEMDLIEGLLLMSMFLAFYFVFNWTKSIKASAIAAGCILGLVLAITIYRRILYEEKLKKSGIKDIDQMEGRQFERYLGHLFKQHGYTVRVTQESGDFGADLVIEKDKRKIVVQAKRYSKNVGLKAVQEAQTSMAHYGAVEAWVVSNADFTTAAYTLAKSNKVTLIHRQALIDMILQTKQVAATVLQAEEVPIRVTKELVQKKSEPIVEDVNCARCGSYMVRRLSARGEFLGCSNFPKCRNVITINS